ncbi:YcaO-like family protein [Glycomyces salinus]|uniref:YcaO-like family protein n=1 Tax=Glycomyces salinus TaxID=980294 RepID=UPI0018EA9D8F|nr:YcaO-like family protein [Glycomyces salinus]
MPNESATVAARVEIRALSGGRALITVPTGSSFAVDTAPDTVFRLVEAITTGDASPLLPADWPELAADLRAALEEGGAFAAPEPAGALEPPPEVEAWEPGDEAEARAGDLLLLGDFHTVHALGQALRERLPATRAVRSVDDSDWQRVIHRAFRSGEVLVHCVRGGDEATLSLFDRHCADARTPWIAVEAAQSRIWAGPAVAPGVGASYEDFAARRLAAAVDPEAHRAMRTPSLTGDCGLAPHQMGTAAAALADLLSAGLEGDTVAEIAADGSVRTHPVLPLPGRAATGALDHVPDDLVDPATGLVQRVRFIEHHPSVPPGLVTAQTDVANMRLISRWANNTSCQGSAFGDRAQAEASAVGEAVERYCGNLLDTLPVTYGSYQELRRGPVRVLAPDDLVLYSENQYRAPGFPFTPLTGDLAVHWVPGRSLTRDEDVLVPASMVYVNWFTAGYSAAPVTNFCPFAGIAAGPDLDYAIVSGLEEVIERHATMVWWINGHPLPASEPTPRLERLWDGVDPEYRQRPSIIMLDNEFGVPVAAGVLHDDASDFVNVGFASRHTPEAAVEKAWTEALTLQEGSRDLADPEGAHWAAMARGELNSRSFKPWRPDRRYLDDYREDMRDCDDLMVQQQVFLDPRAVERMAHLLEPAATRPLAETPALPERTVAAYRAAVEARGLEVIVVDLTTPDVAATGMAAVRVIVPGTVGNAPAAFPFLGKGVLQGLAVEHGWRDEPLPESELNHFPIPHA